jgi:hypothetical protein
MKSLYADPIEKACVKPWRSKKRACLESSGQRRLSAKHMMRQQPKEAMRERMESREDDLPNSPASPGQKGLQLSNREGGVEA